MRKPVIALRKVDEAAFINARTYWSLSHSSDHDADETYELQVRHWAPEDEFEFVSHAAHTRGALRLVTREEFNGRIMNLRMNEDISHDDAFAQVASHCRMMTPGEALILEHLTRTWNAFVFLFEPATNM